MNPLIELDLAGEWRFTPERGEPVFMSAGVYERRWLLCS